MSKKDFIALANAIKWHNQDTSLSENPQPFTPVQILTIAHFCQSQNPNFNRERWLDYIAGKCGPNGGAK